MKSLKYAYALAGTTAATMFAGTAHAAVKGTDIDGGIQPNGSLRNRVFDFGDLKNAIASIINIILFLAGILAILYLIYSGIQYVTSAGNADKVKVARAGVINAVIGIIIITATFFIINFAVGLGSGSASILNSQGAGNTFQ